MIVNFIALSIIAWIILHHFSWMKKEGDWLYDKGYGHMVKFRMLLYVITPIVIILIIWTLI